MVVLVVDVVVVVGFPVGGATHATSPIVAVAKANAIHPRRRPTSRPPPIARALLDHTATAPPVGHGVVNGHQQACAKSAQRRATGDGLGARTCGS
ncbi:MAG TPA: hypothetical protein PLV13_05330, partial [Ilumatobacteraceae bacterium]|nr:hypothetical protein [Ilumatobacteraceae bacterium]